MKIHFQLSGGLEGGIVIDKKIDTDSISPEESSKLEKLINESNFFNLPEHIQTNKNSADYFTYKISIENQTKKHSIERKDFSIESKLDPLIDYLKNKQT